MTTQTHTIYDLSRITSC